MMNNDLRFDLSIIVPCHNLENHIGKLVDTLKAQDLDFDTTVELIFVLDNCTDNTEAVVQEIIKSLEGTNFTAKYICVQNGSCGLSRNDGYEISSGSLIWFLDGDDWLTHTAVIKNIISTFAAFPSADIVKFGFLSQGYIYECDVMVWLRVFRRSIIGDTRFTAAMPHEDVRFMEEISRKCPTILNLGQRNVWYNYPREGSVMNGASNHN